MAKVNDEGTTSITLTIGGETVTMTHENGEPFTRAEINARVGKMYQILSDAETFPAGATVEVTPRGAKGAQ